MADRDNQVITYLNDSEHSKLKEWSAETGKSMSHLLRDAVLEYTDRDRAARLEGRVDDIDEKLDEVLAALESDTAHTHTPGTSPTNGSEASEKARAIVSRLQSNHDDVMKADVVDRAIEDIAGIDDRTKKKYKKLFRKRGILFEHPGEPPMWTTESQKWLNWMKDYLRLNGREEAEKAAEDYRVSILENLDGGYSIELDETGAQL